MRLWLISLSLLFGLTLLSPLWAESERASSGLSLIATDQAGNTMTIYDRPCSDTHILTDLMAASLKATLEKGLEPVTEFYDGLMIYKGKPYKACWFVHPAAPQMVFILDSEGDKTVIPSFQFEEKSI